jgi:hypothetical protein
MTNECSRSIVQPCEGVDESIKISEHDVCGKLFYFKSIVES